MLLNKTLKDDSFFIADLKLSQLLLSKDANYPWLILVPRVDNITEIIELNDNQQLLLLKEINLISNILKKITNCYKLNIANLGNVVPQLHIHIIARFKDDPSFPQPIWGQVVAKKYNEQEKNKFISKILSQIPSLDLSN